MMTMIMMMMMMMMMMGGAGSPPCRAGSRGGWPDDDKVMGRLDIVSRRSVQDYNNI